MNKKVVVIIVAVVIVAGAAVGVALKNNKSNEPQQSTPESSSNSSPSQEGTTPTNTEEQQGQQNPEATTANSVSIKDMAFSPASLTVKLGTTVTWTNEDATAHTVTADDESGDFGSQLLNKGDTYQYTFNTTGTYTYHCTQHPDMKGTITVTE